MMMMIMITMTTTTMIDNTYVIYKKLKSAAKNKEVTEI
jgi:hypothetical protein